MLCLACLNPQNSFRASFSSQMKCGCLRIQTSRAEIVWESMPLDVKSDIYNPGLVATATDESGTYAEFFYDGYALVWKEKRKSIGQTSLELPVWWPTEKLAAYDAELLKNAAQPLAEMQAEYLTLVGDKSGHCERCCRMVFSFRGEQRTCDCQEWGIDALFDVVHSRLSLHHYELDQERIRAEATALVKADQAASRKVQLAERGFYAGSAPKSWNKANVVLLSQVVGRFLQHDHAWKGQSIAVSREITPTQLVLFLQELDGSKLDQTGGIRIQNRRMWSESNLLNLLQDASKLPLHILRKK